MTHEWRDRALCAGYDTEAWFPDGTGSDFEIVARPAKAVCRKCDVRLACLAFALDAEGNGAERTRYGIYGGMGPAERAALVRQGAA